MAPFGVIAQQTLSNATKHKPIYLFKRNENCKDLLVRRKHNNTFYKSKPGTVSCGKKCAVCPYIIENDVFIDKEGQQFYTKGFIKCDANNLIYGIYCNQYKNIIYVGETMNTLLRIRTGRNLEPMSDHFRNENHSIRDYRIIGIEKTNKNEELFWISKLKTWKPLSLMVKNNLNTINTI